MSKFNTVTIIHNQAINLARILESYTLQTFQPSEYVFVLDRCVDDSLSIIQLFAEHHKCIILESNEDCGFMAGYCRNIGLNGINNPEIVLFLDGDCVIASTKLFEMMYCELSDSENSRIVLSSRVNETPKGDVGDIRMSIPWVKDHVFIEGFNNMVSAKYIARWEVLVYSCCLGMNISAISSIVDINLSINGEGELFPSVFNGNWGGEDIYVGWVAMLMDMDVIALDPTYHVRHIWHESRDSSAYKKTAETQYNKLLQYANSQNTKGLNYTKLDLNMLAFDAIRRNIK